MGQDGGVPIFEQLFKFYDGNPIYQEIPYIEASAAFSELSFYTAPPSTALLPSSATTASEVNGAPTGTQKKDYNVIPERFTFLSASGMYSGNLEYLDQNPGDSVIDNFSMLP